jgi:hypothetical protein
MFGLQEKERAASWRYAAIQWHSHGKGRSIQDAARLRIEALALLALAACRPGGQADIAQPRAPDSTAAERAYRAPPSADSATLVTGGRVLLAGRADARSRVRLATPAGQAVFAPAAANGRWRLVLGGSPQVRLFGLSMIEQGRAVQAEGYLVVTPQGAAAQLRAGSGARVLSHGGAPRILAVDFDRKGGTVVSGIGPAGATVSVGVDGTQRGRTQADGAGRFALALDEPLSGGDHALEVDGAGVNARARVSVSPAAPPAGGPFLAALTPWGWRIDWMTPGGGVQTTLLIAPAQPLVP